MDRCIKLYSNVWWFEFPRPVVYYLTLKLFKIIHIMVDLYFFRLLYKGIHTISSFFLISQIINILTGFFSRIISFILCFLKAKENSCHIEVFLQLWKLNDCMGAPQLILWMRSDICLCMFALCTIKSMVQRVEVYGWIPFVICKISGGAVTFMQPFISYKALFRKRKQRLEILICYDVRFIIFSNERFKIIYLQPFNKLTTVLF